MAYPQRYQCVGDDSILERDARPRRDRRGGSAIRPAVVAEGVDARHLHTYLLPPGKHTLRAACALRVARLSAKALSVHPDLEFIPGRGKQAPHHASCAYTECAHEVYRRRRCGAVQRLK